MRKENYEGQIFGRRQVLKNYCTQEDWDLINRPMPKNNDNYCLAKCLNCGSVSPVLLRSIKRTSPKRCCLCSNIGNHRKLDTLTNSWVVYDEYAVLNILYKKETISVYVDSDKYDMLKDFSWRISKKRNKLYVVTGNAKTGNTYIHQMILGKAPSGYSIDHIDGNSLNNRLENLRFLTISDNARFVKQRCDSQIGIRGVAFDKRYKKYTVDFSYDHKRYYFKPFKTIEEAVWCRYYAEQYFGIETLIKNPLFENYLDLDDTNKQEIKQYVHSIVSKGKPSV